MNGVGSPWRIHAGLRVMWSITVLWLVVTISFFLSRAAPGGPFDHLLGVSAAAGNARMEAMGMNAPLPAQYFDYLANILTGDFGESLVSVGVPVADILRQGLATSATIAVPAILSGAILGSWLAVRACLRKREEASLRGIMVVILTTPVFVTGPLLSLVFAVWLGWLPVAGVSHGLWSLVLPVAAVSLPIAAMVYLLLFDSLQIALSSPYIRGAKAKGQTRRRIVLDHALPSALLPVLHYLAPTVAFTIAGSMVIETVFDLPGAGRIFIQSAIARDYPVVLAFSMTIGCLIIVCNLLADICLSLVDPRNEPGGTLA